MSTGFGWRVALLSGWMTAGAYLDAWAHRNRPELETFFTPWHAVLYSGFLAVSGYLVWRRLERGVLPAGYRLSLVGSVVFLAGGLGDMLWHLGFGVEESLEALLSPTHLVLAVGAGLIVTGPLRAALARGEAGWPAVLSASWLLSLITFFTQYGHPFVEVLATRPVRDEGSIFSVAGVEAILLQTLVLVALTLVLITRMRLPLGALTVLVGLNAVLLASLDRDWLMGAIGLGGALLGDLLVEVLRPSSTRALMLRAFAVSWPVGIFGLYFGTLELTRGVGWTLELWAGSVAVAGLAGWLVSYAVVPPRPASPEEPSGRLREPARLGD